MLAVSGGEIFAALFMSLTLTLEGVSCLLWPRVIQEYALKQNTKWTSRLNPFLEWMKTAQYLTYLRIMGGVILGMGVILTAIFMKKWYESWFI